MTRYNPSQPRPPRCIHRLFSNTKYSIILLVFLCHGNRSSSFFFQSPPCFSRVNDPQQGFHQFSFNLLSIGGKVSNNHLSAVSDNNEYGDVSREWDVSARRKFLQSVCSFTAVSTGVVFGADDRLGSNVANAVVTDETSRWSNTEVEGSSYAKINDKESLNPTVSVSKPIGKQSNAKASDEFTVVFDKDDILNGGKLGLELQNVEFRTNRRVQVKSVKEGSLADLLGVSNLMVVVAVNGESTERTDAKGVQIMVSRAVTAIREGKESKDLELTFRDPDVFLNELRKISEGETLTTKVAPAGDTTQRREDGSAKGEVISQDDQKLSVSQIRAPAMCNRGATTDDLLEISYVGSIYETGEIFDGSAVLIDGKGIPGRGNDVSLFFVLGKQPFGQFPPGWDVSMVGMCVGERRRILIPPVLAYGSVGVPRRGIPPNATLQYDVTLVSINGNALPQ